MKKSLLHLHASVFFSGAAALIYEILWTRGLSLYIGSTVESSSVVFSSFVLGLSFGAYYFSKKAFSYKNLLTRLVLLEVLIALVSSVLGVLLFYFSEDFQYYGNHFLLNHFFVAVFIFLLVLIPTFLMGGVFPLWIEFMRRLQIDEKHVSSLYGVNTLGAAFGVFIAVFFILPKTGILETFLCAGLMNLISASLVVYLFFKNNKSGDQGKAYKNFATTACKFKIFEFKEVLLISFLSGFFIFLQEIIWIKLSSLFIGNRVFASSLLLIVILIFLFLGAAFSKLVFKRSNKGSTPYMLLIISALGSLASVCVFQYFIFYKLNASVYLGVWTVLMATIAILAPVFSPLAILFPYTLQKIYAENKDTSSYLGAFYIWNAVASVLGALLGAYVLSPLIGSVKTLNFTALLLFAVGFCGLILKYSKITKTTLSAVTTSFLVLLTYSYSLDFTFIKKGEDLVYQKEDRYGLFQIVKSRDGITHVRNNFTNLINGLEFLDTSYAQQMQAHLGVHFKPKTQNVLIIGSGYGITAGTFGLYDRVKKIDVVEILPEVLKQTERFRDYNFDAKKNKKINFIQDDGRRFLVESKHKYDVISVNVTDPSLPGISSFFYDQFYKIIKSKLTKNGVYLTHVFGTNYLDIVNLLKKSFKHVRFFTSYKGCRSYKCYNVVATDSETGLKSASFAVNQKVQRGLSLIKVDDLKKAIFSTEVFIDDSLDSKQLKKLSEFYPGIEFMMDSKRRLFWSNQ